MSWLPNPFKSLPPHADEESLSDAGDDSAVGSVKEDLSVIGETIGRQLRGVAAFLAPPAPPSSEASCSSPSAAVNDDTGGSMSPSLARIRSDVAELGGSFKSSLSLLSNNAVVAEVSKMASNFLHLDGVDEEEEDEDLEQDDRGVGITDSVLQFVTEISKRPECWTDFPLLLNQDFIMSPAQAEHVAVIVDLVPSLAELRDRLSDMAADRFWMIYFILLLPRLNRDSVDLLSTPEIVETRSALLNMLLNKRNSAATYSQKDHTDNSSQSDSKLDQDRHDRNLSQEKAVMADNIEPSRDVEPQGMKGKRSEEEDATTTSAYSHLQSKDVDDISFSDLEDDDTDLSTRH